MRTEPGNQRLREQLAADARRLAAAETAYAIDARQLPKDVVDGKINKAAATDRIDQRVKAIRSLRRRLYLHPLTTKGFAEIVQNHANETGRAV